MRNPTRAIAALAALATVWTASGLAHAQKPDGSRPDTQTDMPRLVAGTALLSVGASATLAGGVAYTVLGARTQPCDDSSCIDPDATAKKGSLVGMLLGGAAMAAGIPLILTSVTTKRKDGKTSGAKEIAALPVLRVGPASASLTWSF